MPDVECAACHLRVYSAAFYARVDECPRCGVELPRPARSGAAGPPGRWRNASRAPAGTGGALGV